MYLYCYHNHNLSCGLVGMHCVHLGACISGEIHINCDRISPLPVKSSLWLLVGEISVIIGRRKTALAHTPCRQVLLAISTRSHPIFGHFLEFEACWPILVHAGDKDNFTDSKYVPLQHRTLILSNLINKYFTVHL